MRFFIKNKKRSAGQSTLEIIIASAILAISLTAVAVVISTSQSVSTDTHMSSQATNIARELIESAIASSTGAGFNSIVSSSSTQADFLKEIIVQNVDSNTKQITARVSWQNGLRTEKAELTTLVTNWQISKSSGGDTGGTGLTGDWQHPKTLGSIDLGPGEVATGIDVINKIIYLSATASDQKKSDFFVVNATNGQSPYIAGSIDTGPGLNAIDATAGYAYAANNSETAQLQVINTSNPSSPLLVASYKLQGNSADARSVFYSSGKVYVGTETGGGPEFHVVDVSNPTNPFELGSFAVGANVNDIYVSGNIAYLATSADNAELTILDMSNPAAIRRIGSFDAPGGNDGKSVFVSGSTAYLGRSSGSNDFMIIDVSNPASPRQLSSNTLNNAGINGIYVRDYLAFIVTDDSNNEFQIWNISNPASIALWSEYNFPQVGTGIDYENNIVYASVRSNDAVRIITSGL